MEEKKRLQAIDGSRCEQYLHPAVGGKTPLGAFLATVVRNVMLLDDPDLMVKILHELQLGLMKHGELELAQLTGLLELESREMEKEKRFPQPTAPLVAISQNISNTANGIEVNAGGNQVAQMITNNYKEKEKLWTILNAIKGLQST